MIAAVKVDLEAIADETDHGKFLLDSQKLQEDFDILDTYDDMLRRSYLT
jgi:hypothetical protein